MTVAEKLLKEGIVIKNTPYTKELVKLRHFAENPELIKFMKEN